MSSLKARHVNSTKAFYIRSAVYLPQRQFLSRLQLSHEQTLGRQTWQIGLIFLGVGKNFRLLMQSCCFFFSRPFHENFKFLKNCPYDFYKILHSHSTPKGAPACAMASKSYDWVVRNIAKISPKMPEKQPFFDFFRFSQKLSIRFERNFLQLFYTILESYMCNGIKIVWLGCENYSKN